MILSHDFISLSKWLKIAPKLVYRVWLFGLRREIVLSLIINKIFVMWIH